MIIISSREFRDNQKKYFDLIDSNAQIIVQRGKTKSYKLVPVTPTETLMTESEFYKKIQNSLDQAEAGEVTRFENFKDFKNFIDK